jgi:hypothetical protein
MKKTLKKTFALSLALAAACGGSTTKNNPGYDAACSPAAGNALNTSCNPGFTANSPNTPRSIQVTFSGETLGVAGLPFQPVNAGDPTFVDGWSMTFDELLVVLGNFRLSPNALQYGGTSLSPQINAPVATKNGPYVVDMHTPSGIVGKDGIEPAQGLFVWNILDNGDQFDTSMRYAFSYDTLQAKYPVANVNLTPSQQADYDLMVSKGWSKLYRGTATYVGTGTYPNTAIQAKFGALPKTVKFFFGWNDATSYINCVNPDNGGTSEGDPTARGVKPLPNGAYIAQTTLHVDHVFWDQLLIHGTPLRFDAVAAWAPPSSATTPVDLSTILHHSLTETFGDGTTPLPDRGPYQNVPGGYTTDQANPAQVVLNLAGVPSSNVPDIINFMAFSAQSQMHLNANGLCYVKGQNAADPFFNPNIP